MYSISNKKSRQLSDQQYGSVMAQYGHLVIENEFVISVFSEQINWVSGCDGLYGLDMFLRSRAKSAN